MENTYVNRNGTGSAFAWCLIGAATGAAVGLLLAPRPGKQTRAKLAKGWRDTVDSASELGSELSDRARGVATRAASAFRKAAAVADNASVTARDAADTLEREA